MRKNRHPPARPSKGETATFKEFCLASAVLNNLEQGGDRQTHAVETSRQLFGSLCVGCPLAPDAGGSK